MLQEYLEKLYIIACYQIGNMVTNARNLMNDQISHKMHHVFEEKRFSEDTIDKKLSK